MSKYISIVLMLLMLLVVPFFMKDSNGDPIMNWAFAREQLSKGLEPFQEITEDVKEVTGVTSTPSSSPSGVYRWQDTQGRWHYGDEPPAQAEEVKIDTQMNIVSLPVRELDTSEPEQKSGPSVTVLRDRSASKDLDIGASGNPVDRIQQGLQLKEQVEQISAKLDARAKAMDEMFVN